MFVWGAGLELCSFPATMKLEPETKADVCTSHGCRARQDEPQACSEREADFSLRAAWSGRTKGDIEDGDNRKRQDKRTLQPHKHEPVHK